MTQREDMSSASILKQEDLQVDVVRAEGGDYAVFRHIKLNLGLRYPLKDMARGGLEFIAEIMRTITLDVDLALKLSADAAKLVSQARTSNVTQLLDWANSQSRDRIFIAIFELLRRGEPLPEDTLYGNPNAMSDDAIRNYIFTHGRHPMGPDRE